MTTPFLGEIQLFGFNYAPVGWALCNGATLQLQQFSALFSLLGTSYGGNGTTNFMLPNFANRVPCSQGQGPGLPPYTIGESFGSNGVALTTDQLPTHNHTVTIYGQNDNSKRTGMPANGNYLSNPHSSATDPFSAPPATSQFNPNVLGMTGGNQPHENRQPALALNFCIALQGAFPSFG